MWVAMVPDLYAALYPCHSKSDRLLWLHPRTVDSLGHRRVAKTCPVIASGKANTFQGNHREQGLW